MFRIYSPQSPRGFHSVCESNETRVIHDYRMTLVRYMLYSHCGRTGLWLGSMGAIIYYTIQQCSQRSETETVLFTLLPLVLVYHVETPLPFSSPISFYSHVTGFFMGNLQDFSESLNFSFKIP